MVGLKTSSLQQVSRTRKNLRPRPLNPLGDTVLRSSWPWSTVSCGCGCSWIGTTGTDKGICASLSDSIFSFSVIARPKLASKSSNGMVAFFFRNEAVNVYAIVRLFIIIARVVSAKVNVEWWWCLVAKCAAVTVLSSRQLRQTGQRPSCRTAWSDLAPVVGAAARDKVVLDLPNENKGSLARTLTGAHGIPTTPVVISNTQRSSNSERQFTRLSHSISLRMYAALLVQ
jgi:hypothetical protein